MENEIAQGMSSTDFRKPPVIARTIRFLYLRAASYSWFSAAAWRA
jgi:hypothetical protein